MSMRFNEHVKHDCPPSRERLAAAEPHLAVAFGHDVASRVRDIACGWEQVASGSVAPDVRGRPGVGRRWGRQAARRRRAPSRVPALATARARSWGVAPAGE